MKSHLLMQGLHQCPEPLGDHTAEKVPGGKHALDDLNKVHPGLYQQKIKMLRQSSRRTNEDASRTVSIVENVIVFTTANRVNDRLLLSQKRIAR